MTCRGYDPRAVKVPKAIKRMATTFAKPGALRSFYKSYAQAIAANARASSRKLSAPKDE